MDGSESGDVELTERARRAREDALKGIGFVMLGRVSSSLPRRLSDENIADDGGGVECSGVQLRAGRKGL
jgi:hypothetical protein